MAQPKPSPRRGPEPRHDAIAPRISLALGHIKEAVKLIANSADQISELGKLSIGCYASDISERLCFLTSKIFDDLNTAQAATDAWGAANGIDTSLSPLADKAA
jgi:hypothetical protein